MTRRRLSVSALACGAAFARSPPSAALPTNCTQSSSAPTVSCTYVSILNEQTFTVPAGVTSIQVTAVGAPGGDVGAVPGGPGEDFFCLEPQGVRVGIASPKLLGTLKPKLRGRYRDRVVWVSTADPIYAVEGIRPGATQKAAELKLRHGNLFRIGANEWYLAKAGPATAVLKIRHGQVQEVGIAVRALSGTRSRQRTLMSSFQ